MAAAPRTESRTDQEGAKPPWLTVAPFVFLLLWSAGFPVAMIGIERADPLTLLALRFALVLVVLAPLMAILRPPLPKRGIDWLHLSVVGLLVQTMYFGFCWVAFDLGISAGVAALIIALQPVLVAAVAPRAVGEAVGRLRWLGLALGLAGAALVILARSAIEATSLAALICTAVAVFSMVAGTLYEKRFGVTHHPVTSNFIQYAVGLVAVLPVAWLLEPMAVAWDGTLVAALAYLVVCNSLVAITLFLAMIRHGEASRVSALFYLVPPTAAVLAWLLIGEEMPLLAWPGMLLAAVGVALVGRPRPRIRQS